MSAAPEHGQLHPYDAILMISFGGPENPAEVMPFLENVTKGRVPRERLGEVEGHYQHFGGRSPINDQCRELLSALRTELDARGISLPVYWGNKHSEPWLNDTVASIAADGHRRVLVFTTSAYPSYSGCRSYREELYDALSLAASENASDLASGELVRVDRIRHYGQHPGFLDANYAAVAEAVGQCSATPRLVFVTHSIPDSMAEVSGPKPHSEQGGYVDWQLDVGRNIVDRLRAETGQEFDLDLAYCSRSGPPSQPWLEPDVNDRMRELVEQGANEIVLAPIGFISDHMEVVFDLDTEARETADELGITMVRADTVGTKSSFVSALADLMVERAMATRGESVEQPVISGARIAPLACAVDCCPNPRQPGRPAACQQAPARV